MNGTRAEFLLWVTTLFTLLATETPAAEAQQSRPVSRFNTYSGNPLPGASGLRLQEGQDRPRGAPQGVYNPGEPKLNYKLVRWESRYMPLKVWISPGKKLQEEPISVINAQRPQEVLQLLRQDPSLNSLPQCPRWDAEMTSAAKSGIEQWKEFEPEGLFSFVFVDDPAIANIFVFWTERFQGDEGVGGVTTGGNTVAVLYDASEVHQKEAAAGQPLQGTPVIIEVQVLGDYEKLQARVAHEFGHALGIKEHSPFNDDLMCVNGIAKYLSPSDKATIRWLYRQQPAYVMLPPVIPRFQAQPVAQQQAQENETGRGAGGGGYKIHMARPNSRTVDDSAAQDNSESTSAASFQSSRQSTDEARPSKKHDSSAAADDDRPKAHKTKHSKDSDQATPVSTPPPQIETPAQPPPEPSGSKASEGY